MPPRQDPTGSIPDICLDPDATPGFPKKVYLYVCSDTQSGIRFRAKTDNMWLTRPGTNAEAFGAGELWFKPDRARNLRGQLPSPKSDGDHFKWIVHELWWRSVVPDPDLDGWNGWRLLVDEGLEWEKGDLGKTFVEWKKIAIGGLF